MSRRNFTRLFRAELGTTPRAYVEHVRIDAARRELEGTGLPIKRIARDAGFGTAETLHRVFERRLGVAPQRVPPAVSRAVTPRSLPESGAR
jgi:transcriptional regulator GlxA family with amidase domain